MVHLQRPTLNVTHRKFSSQAPTQTRVSNTFISRENSKRKSNIDDFDSTQRKKAKGNEPSNARAAPTRYDEPSTSLASTFEISRQLNNPPEFSSYRARRSRNNPESLSTRQQSRDVMPKTPIRVTHGHDAYNDDENDDEEEPSFDSTQRAVRDVYKLDELPLNRSNSRRDSHQHANRSARVFDDEDDEDCHADDNEDFDTSSDRPFQQYFNNKFDQLKYDLTTATDQLTGTVQTQLNKLDKQMRVLSKTVHVNSVNPSIAPYQNPTHQFPKVVDFNGLNLITVSRATDYKKFARSLLKTLFSRAELANSILFSNQIYSRPGLDPSRMALWAEAVCARFRIDPLHFDEFLRNCLRRTLAQMLCDVRREYRRSGANNSPASGGTHATGGPTFRVAASPGDGGVSDEDVEDMVMNESLLN
ncbi:unnamed protein product [Adineta ricciae]|uniref:BEN domain-containing protein n=1 Tax=Adineta ricciae TaxID=249248 RepID=A0A814SIB2_ADIRI|nr:unnamed protein product [Adineta ricciae]